VRIAQEEQVGTVGASAEASGKYLRGRGVIDALGKHVAELGLFGCGARR
jgi:hypothetical protein